MMTCFVVSPIGEDGSPTRANADKLFKYIIKPVCEECGFDAIRVDQLNDANSINNTQHDTTKKRSHKSGSSCYFRGMRGYISISKSSGFRRLPGTAIFL